MEKIAVIDLGTNTFDLLIAEKTNNSIKHLLKIKEAVMLGKEGINAGIISEQAQQRAYTALQKFKNKIDSYQCKQTIAIGTSAIRSAKNMSDFINKVETNLDIKIQTISGNMEADFVFEGVKKAVNLTNENYLILDIGGGSNEFIIANKESVLWKHSFNLGVTRLLEQIPLSDPVTKNEIETLNEHLHNKLFLLKQALDSYPVTKLIGVAGVFNNFAKIIYNKKNTNNYNTDTYNTIELTDFEQMSKEIIASTRQQRLQIEGLEDIRVDVAVMATLFTNMIIKLSNVTGIIQSRYALEEGVIFSI